MHRQAEGKFMETSGLVRLKVLDDDLKGLSFSVDVDSSDLTPIEAALPQSRPGLDSEGAGDSLGHSVIPFCDVPNQCSPISL
jgi:hypothetical protein